MLNGPAGLLFDDLAVHEHDLRGALRRPDHDALEAGAALPSGLAALSGSFVAAGLGAVEVRGGSQVWRSHDGPVGWALLVEPWEALRALSSRRTADELRALPSEGDVEPYLPVLDAHLPLPAASLCEC